MDFNKANDFERKQIQYIFYRLILVLLKALAPILPTTSEEIYEHFNCKNKLSSVHMLSFLEKNQKSNQEELK
mgnify:CR=1 FL=1